VIYRRTFLSIPPIVAASVLMLPWRSAECMSRHAAWTGKRVPEDVVVEFMDGRDLTDPVVSSVLTRHRAKLIQVFNRKVFHFTIAGSDAEPLARELVENNLVKYAEPNGLSETNGTPNDTNYGSQGHLPVLNCPAAWNTLQLNNLPLATMPVCIDINNGCQTSQADLSANIISQWNIVNSSSTLTDTIGHGTACIGYQGAATNNAAGVASVGWGGSIIPIQVSTTGSISSTNVEAAFQWIISNVPPPGTINMPFSGSSLLTISLTTTIPTLYKMGFFLCCGSQDISSIEAPNGASVSDFTLCTTGTQGQGGSPFAIPTDWTPGYGPPFLVGPPQTGRGCVVATCAGTAATGLLTTGLSNTYTSWYGCSMATSIMSGIVRYLMCAYYAGLGPKLSNADIWYIITNPANGTATTGFTGVPAPWSNPPFPLLDACLAAAISGQRSPFSGKRGRR